MNGSPQDNGGGSLQSGWDAQSIRLLCFEPSSCVDFRNTIPPHGIYKDENSPAPTRCTMSLHGYQSMSLLMESRKLWKHSFISLYTLQWRSLHASDGPVMWRDGDSTSLISVYSSGTSGRQVFSSIRSIY